MRGVGHATGIIMEALSERATEAALKGNGVAAAELMTMAASWHGHDTIAWRLSNLLDEAGRSSFLEQVRDLLPESDAVGAGSEPDRQKPENRESPNPTGRRFGDEEIGRASGRERGCQYVEVAVCAVSIKK